MRIPAHITGAKYFWVFIAGRMRAHTRVCVWCVCFSSPELSKFTEGNARDLGEIYFLGRQATQNHFSPCINMHEVRPLSPPWEAGVEGEKSALCDWCLGPAHGCWHPINQGGTAAS